MPGFAEAAKEMRSVARTLATAGPRAEALAAAVVIKSLTDIEADAKRLCPVDTGFLKNSISREFTADTFRGSGGAFGGQVGPTASYGAYVEYGTGGGARRAAAVAAFGGSLAKEDVGGGGGMAPEPYMGPAFERRAPGFVAAMEQIPDKVFKL